MPLDRNEEKKGQERKEQYPSMVRCIKMLPRKNITERTAEWHDGDRATKIHIMKEKLLLREANQHKNVLQVF